MRIFPGWIIQLLVLLFLLPVRVYGQAQVPEQFLVVPACLLVKHFAFEELAHANYLYFIKTKGLSSVLAASKRNVRCNSFMNVTEAWEREKLILTPQDFLNNYTKGNDHLSDLSHSYKIQYQAQVNALLPQIHITPMRDFLLQLIVLADRNHLRDHGIKAADWIKQQIDTFVQAQNHSDVITYLLPTLGDDSQPSVIAKIGKDLLEPGIVIGAHMDSVRLQGLSKPGADDASGAATLLEVARVLLSSHLTFKKPIYLIWYASKEVGYLGSQSVVNSFNENKILVDAVLQLDLTGFVGKKDIGIGLVNEATDAALTAYVADLINTYVKLPVGAVSCSFACSDHVTWYQNGYRVAYPLEAMNDDEVNPYIHTAKDTVDKISLHHMQDFAKLTTAFAVELAEPILQDSSKN